MISASRKRSESHVSRGCKQKGGVLVKEKPKRTSTNFAGSTKTRHTQRAQMPYGLARAFFAPGWCQERQPPADTEAACLAKAPQRCSAKSRGQENSRKQFGFALFVDFTCSCRGWSFFSNMLILFQYFFPGVDPQKSHPSRFLDKLTGFCGIHRDGALPRLGIDWDPCK